MDNQQIMHIAFDTASNGPARLLEADSFVLDKPEQAEHDAGKVDKGKKLRCIVCNNEITDEGQRMLVNDRHQYSRTNPHGVKFTFACFSEACGCAVIGPPSDEASWFASHSWQIVVCRACGEHLGWIFKGAEVFFGLITDRLVSDEDK